MLINNLYVVYDRLAQESGPVFEAKNDLVASRNYRQILKEANPSEYLLLRVGNIDHERNTIDAEATPVQVDVPGGVKFAEKVGQ